MAARWDTRNGGVVSRQRVFDSSGFYTDPFHAAYTIHPDGKRFLMLQLTGHADTGVIWIENFAAGLEDGGGS
jgi:hypothetical protein